MGGLKPEFLQLLYAHKVLGDDFPEYENFLLQKIYNVLEDVYSVGSATELQEAIDQIGDGAGTVFIESGTHEITVPIDIDGSGSLIIYGHGNNTILKPADGITVFNITDAESVILEKLRFDTSNYTGATQTILVNEVNNNVISFQNISIIGNNIGIGIELQSDNCMIEHCNISQLQDGIYLNSSNRNIIAQNLIQNNTRYGINANTTLYSSINGNNCNQNLMGIYIASSTNNSISNNICNQNTENGIYITGSSYNTISGNTCENNDSNTANDQAGMFITNNSNFNTISGNSLNNNNNLGVGDGIGLVIATATCVENVVASNNANGNDVDWKDAGLRTVIKYYVQTGDELQDAIDSIGTGAGTVVITTGTLTLTTTITVDGGGYYIIEGEGNGSIIDCNGNRTAFNITNAKGGTTLKNFKITNTTATAANRIVVINEGSDVPIIIENLTITGHNNWSRGIQIYSNNVSISHCWFETLFIGIETEPTTYKHQITNNYFTDMGYSSIWLDTTHNNIISNNIMELAQGGIHLINNSDKNIIEGNLFKDLTPFEAIGTAGGCSENLINDNIFQNCAEAIDWSGNGRNIFSNNIIIGGNDIAIKLSASDNNVVSGNIIRNYTNNDATNRGAIWLAGNSCDYNTITGNIISTNVNNGAGITYAIYIDNVNSTKNVIGGNSIDNNESDIIQDIGTNTIILGDDTVYGAGWNNNLGTATKNAVYDELNNNRYTKTQVDSAIDADILTHKNLASAHHIKYTNANARTAVTKTGSYSGNGGTNRTISVGFPPKSVDIFSYNGGSTYRSFFKTNTMPTYDVWKPDGGTMQQSMYFSGNNFVVYPSGKDDELNTSGWIYYWVVHG